MINSMSSLFSGNNFSALHAASLLQMPELKKKKQNQKENVSVLSGMQGIGSFCWVLSKVMEEEVEVLGDGQILWLVSRQRNLLILLGADLMLDSCAG